MLGATGYLDINAKLLLSEDLLLVAGGDLHIKELSSSTEALTLTLVSASGVVSVEQVPASLRLKILAWRGILVPPATAALQGSPRLLFLTRNILGLGR